MIQDQQGYSAREYQDVLDYLYNSLPMFQRVGDSAYKKDLSNTIRLCDALGNPEHKFKSVHIAGTNGKGSSSHYLAAILQSAGYKTGLYTSPHLKSFTERIRLDGREVTPAFVIEFVRKHKALIEEVCPSFFEITVAMAFTYFAEQEVDIAVIEVGMGGRLDSTNVILPEVSLITNISYDHQQWLGNSLPEIASEKAGIIKDHIPVVITEYQDEVAEVFRKKALQHESQIIFAGEQYSVQLSEEGYRLKMNDGKVLFFKDELLPGYQLKNIPGVLAVCDILNERGFNIPEKAVITGLEQMKSLTGLKGRWQQLGSKPDVFCDVGHNVSGIAYLLNLIGERDYQQLYFVWGMVRDKDVKPALSLLPTSASYFFCEANIPRAMPATELREKALELGLKGESIADVNDALQAALKIAGKDDLIIVGGSNFVVAELKNL
ncbi:bifunctional folylpolyglutamate synthase/dihydrofolate synthase [Fulvivirga sedimenti]|uniref:Dihydrofolate synthase/folylpolyglutamate synthase n=1 Tax=Fulvivirga sedimenti TaxID=2879465 RepID=A0A9X1KV20_9BACT|nr:folylpolyglutamate synthase/dihydrofolate synthase family protein [Fulvivirga sedimenti]MCA6073325.1 bifunctional folylpolyglutamate synthase/dihydrofolate synthase [Fulvivirga sedimenti]